jgi:hypothetical protein
MRIVALLRVVCLLGLTISGAAQTTAASDDTLQHLQFREVDTLFANPGQGWFVEPYRQPRLPDSVVYVRFNWEQVEPSDGTFDWTLIDRAIARARLRGATIAMRVMTANAHSNGPYSSPKWLFKEGCRSYSYKNDGSDAAMGGKPMKRFEPDYEDPIYLAKHSAFLQALGERYNGDPNVEFLDIGSYGIWGEWHTTHPASVAVRQQIVDMYLRAFPKTPLVYMSDDAEVMNYALAHGAGLRRDGVGDPWHEARWADTPAYANVPTMGDAWKHAPIVFEWFLDFDYLTAHHWSFDSAVNFMLKNHVTMINDNLGPVPPEVMPQLEKLARLAGYRFVLRELTEPKAIHAGDSLPLTMQWENVGVGKLYRDYTLSVEVLNAAKAVVATGVVASDPREWLPGKTTATASIPLPASLPPGEYSLSLGLFDTAGQRPPLHLAIDAPDTDGWYSVGKFTVN